MNGPSLIETLTVEKLLRLMPALECEGSNYPPDKSHTTFLQYDGFHVTVWSTGKVTCSDEGDGMIYDMKDVVAVLEWAEKFQTGKVDKNESIFYRDPVLGPIMRAGTRAQ